MIEALAAATAPAHLCELSTDARAAVLLDPEGSVAGASDPDRADALGELARELLEAVDASAGDEPPAEVEAQVERGSVYAVRRGGWAMAVVATRNALPSLMLYDARVVLSRVEETA